MKTCLLLLSLFAVIALAHPPIHRCPTGETRCGNACCPFDCLGGSICGCPSGQIACTLSTGHGVCCGAGTTCTKTGCCATGDIVNGECCLPSSETCCPTGTPSRCDGDGFQSCVDNKWVFTACVAPTFCLPFPVAGAGVACVGPPGS
jgi:hypothetical protein